MFTSDDRPTIRHLPLPAKLVVSVFLISVGTGYLTALVQLHFQHATPGELFPSPEDSVEIFTGVPRARDGDHKPPPEPVSKLEALITAPEGAPFNGQGSMAAAFTTRSIDWQDALEEHGGDEKSVRAERDTERDVMLAWLHSGNGRESAFRDDRFPMPPELKDRPMTEFFLHDDGKDVMIATLFAERCTICHSSGQNGPDLETYEQILPYMRPPTVTSSGQVLSPRRMSVEKLAQSTHAHWLSFSMLFGLTGLVFAFSTYPFWMRVTLAPMVLVVQMIDISCWWLARLEPPVGVYFALAIPITGMIVGAGLVSQIVLSLFSMYRTAGKAVLVGLFLAAGAGVMVLKVQVIDPQLERERAAMRSDEPAAESGEADEADAGEIDAADG